MDEQISLSGDADAIRQAWTIARRIARTVTRTLVGTFAERSRVIQCVVVGLVRSACRYIAVVALVASALASCTATRHSSNVPPGWVRHDFGGLSLAVPAAWKVQRDDSIGRPIDTVIESTVSTVRMCACPKETALSPEFVVWITCFVGRANGVMAGAPIVRIVDGKALRRSGYVVYLQQAASETAVILPAGFGSASLGEQILASVIPSGGTC